MKKHIFAEITIFLWATLPPMSKLLLNNFPSITLLYYSSIVASIALFIILIFTGRIHNYHSYRFIDYVELVLLGLLGEFIYSALYYKGLTILPATDACILNYLWPIISVISACFLLKEKLTCRKVIAIILSFIGVIVVTSKGSALTLFQSQNFTGSMLCILAAICYGLFNVLNKLKGKDQWCNMTIYFTLTAILSGIYCHQTNQLPLPSPEQWFGILWLGIVIDAIGIVIWAIALQGSEVSSIVNLAYATPVVSMFLSIILLREKLNIYSILGLTLILGSFFFQNRKSNRIQSLNKKSKQ